MSSNGISETTETKHRNLIPFQKGQSGNAAGRPKGSRNRLTEDFPAAFAEDFAKHGAAVVSKCREETPHHYLKIAASLLPKQKELDVHLEGDGWHEVISFARAWDIVHGTKSKLITESADLDE